MEFDRASIVGREGHFRVGRAADGKWWFIDPDGEPFFYKGVCAVNRAGTQGGRDAVPGPYAETVDRKYGYQDDPERFVRAVCERLRQWGFNAFGSWTTEEFFDAGMPFTEFLGLNKLGHTVKTDGVNLPDVFDPAWGEAVERRAAELCAPLRGNPMLVGYFTDNEMGWGQAFQETGVEGLEPTVNPGKPSLLQACLSLEPDRPACQAAWDFVGERAGEGAAGLAERWQMADASPETIRAWTPDSRAITTGPYLADTHDFAVQWAERYFRLSAEAVRRHDPNHLVLGCRFGSPPGEAVLEACRRPWVDVLSANNYRDTMVERVDIYWRATGLPVLVGEFAWASGYFVDEGRDPPPLGDLPPERRAAVKGREALERLFTHPGVVGYTWYRWVSKVTDSPVTYGLVDTEDEPRPFSTGLLADIHARAEAIRRGEVAPATIEDGLRRARADGGADRP